MSKSTKVNTSLDNIFNLNLVKGNYVYYLSGTFNGVKVNCVFDTKPEAYEYIAIMMNR